MCGFERNCPREGVPRERAFALLRGDFAKGAPLLRIHSQCLTGEAFGSLRCDCAEQLHMAMAMISKEGAGIILYEEQEGRGIGLMAKLQAYQLQDDGLDTVDANERLGLKADYRDYALPVEVLKALGIFRVRLISNNPDKILALERAGIRVVERIPCEINAPSFAQHYLRTKKERCGHLLASRFANIAEVA
jgi:GTP cyclohydrolase II